MKWNWAVCDVCWNLREPDRQPCRVSWVDVERCAFCGELTISGIWLRCHPSEVNFQECGEKT